MNPEIVMQLIPQFTLLSFGSVFLPIYSCHASFFEGQPWHKTVGLFSHSSDLMPERQFWSGPLLIGQFKFDYYITAYY